MTEEAMEEHAMSNQPVAGSAPEPITAQNVVSQPEAPAAPDSSILWDKLRGLLNEETQEPPSPTANLESEIQRLQEMIQSGTGAGAAAPKKPNYEDELQTLRSEQESLRAELQQRVQQQELTEANKEVSSWVTQNADHFPLTNKAGFQSVVFQKIVNVRESTGRVIDAGQAAREVEEELSALIRKTAPELGYVMREEDKARSEEAKISNTTSGMDVSVPPDWNNMSDQEQLDYLISQAEKR